MLDSDLVDTFAELEKVMELKGIEAEIKKSKIIAEELKDEIEELKVDIEKLISKWGSLKENINNDLPNCEKNIITNNDLDELMKELEESVSQYKQLKITDNVKALKLFAKTFTNIC